MESTGKGLKQPADVSFWYISSLVLFSLGTSSVSFCSAQVLQFTLSSFTASTFLIGLVTSLQALNQLWVTPYAAWKSDRIWTRIGRRKPLVLIITPLLALSIGMIPHCPKPSHLHNGLIEFLSDPRCLLLLALVFVLQMAEDADLAIMTPSISDSVPDRQRPLATAMWRMMLAVSSFLMGRYAMKLMGRSEHWPYTVAAIAVVVTGVVFLLVMRERYVPPRPHDKFRPFSYGTQIVRIREHLLIYVVCLFQPLFVLVGSWYFPKLAKETLMMTAPQYGKAVSWGAFTTMLVCIPLGYLFSHWRYRRAATIGACLFAAVPTTFGLFFMNSARGMALFFALREFAFIVFMLNWIPLIIEYTTPKSVGTVLGFTTAVNGIVRFTMIPFFGYLVDLAGKNYRLPLWGGYVGIIVSVAAILAMRPPQKVRQFLDEPQEAEGIA